MKATSRPTFDSFGLEHLEPRKLLSGGSDDLTFVSFFPEGFASESVSEFVPITNPSDADVRYELHARYETGDRDQLIAAGTIGAGRRGGVTLADSANAAAMRVRPDTPYALVLRSSAPLAATLSHYDFGTAVGESFTTATNTTWTFAEGFKDHQWTRDFVVLYNPGDDAVRVRLTAFTSSGEQITLSRVVEGQRRGGWNLDATAALPQGVFGVRVTADAPIVAAMSHYEIVTQRGFGTLGQAGGGATAGIVPSIHFEDHYGDSYDDYHDEDGHRRRGRGSDDDSSDDGPGDDHRGRGRGGDDDGPGHDRNDDSAYPDNAYLAVLNTNPGAATVTFTFISTDDDFPLQNATRTVTVPGGARGGLSVRDLGFPLDDEFGVLYESDIAVTVTAAKYQGRDAVGIEAIAHGATRWEFGEGFMDRTRAGRDVTEDVYAFNPNAVSLTVRFDFFFSDARRATITKSLDPLEIEDVKVHTEDLVLDIAPGVFYGVRVSAALPIVASQEHWDRSLGGGFATAGMPVGDLTPLAELLNW